MRFRLAALPRQALCADGLPVPGKGEGDTEGCSQRQAMLSASSHSVRWGPDTQEVGRGEPAAPLPRRCQEPAWGPVCPSDAVPLPMGEAASPGTRVLTDSTPIPAFPTPARSLHPTGAFPGTPSHSPHHHHPPPAACTQAGPSHLPTHTRACATHTRSSAHACTKTRAHPRARALAGVAPTHRLNAVGTHTETGPRSAPHP